MRNRRFVMLDRDGTIIAERNYLSSPDGVELVPGAARGLRRMRELGLGLVVITNQSAIGRGLLDFARLDQIHERMTALLADEDVVLDGIYFCPHKPEDACDCRKPGTALPETAARELGFELQRGFVIGDKECDIGMGKRIGSATILVRSGYGDLTWSESCLRPDYVVDDLDGAASLIELLLVRCEGGKR